MRYALVLGVRDAPEPGQGASGTSSEPAGVGDARRYCCDADFWNDTDPCVVGNSVDFRLELKITRQGFLVFALKLGANKVVAPQTPGPTVDQLVTVDAVEQLSLQHRRFRSPMAARGQAVRASAVGTHQ